MRLKQIRLSRNLTQENVAFDANISQSQLSKYENGQNIPSASMLTVLAKVLEVEIFELLYETEKELKSAICRYQNREN